MLLKPLVHRLVKRIFTLQTKMSFITDSTTGG
jgi:hypothetical protein